MINLNIQACKSRSVCQVMKQEKTCWHVTAAIFRNSNRSHRVKENVLENPGNSYNSGKSRQGCQKLLLLAQTNIRTFYNLGHERAKQVIHLFKEPQKSHESLPNHFDGAL